MARQVGCDYALGIAAKTHLADLAAATDQAWCAAVVEMNDADGLLAAVTDHGVAPVGGQFHVGRIGRERRLRNHLQPLGIDKRDRPLVASGGDGQAFRIAREPHCDGRLGDLQFAGKG